MRINGIDIKNIKVNNAIGKVTYYEAYQGSTLLFTYTKPIHQDGVALDMLGLIDNISYKPTTRKLFGQFRRDFLEVTAPILAENSYFRNIAGGYYAGTVQLIGEILYMYVMYQYKKRLAIGRYRDLQKRNAVNENTCIFYFHYGLLPFISTTVNQPSVYYVDLEDLSKGVDVILQRGIERASDDGANMYGYGILVESMFDYGDDTTVKEFLAIYVD